MDILHILKIIAALGTIATGLVALLAPKSIRNFTGLEIPGPRGITEVRAVFGGFFIALGIAPLALAVPQAYAMLGIAYLGVGAVRLVSMFLDKSVVRSNIISLIVEVVFGVILVI